MISLVVLIVPIRGTSFSFAVRENSRIEWSLAWSPSDSIDQIHSLVFQGDNESESIEIYLATNEKVSLHILELDDETEGFRAFLGVAGKEPLGQLYNPRLIFEELLIPILFPLEANLSQDVESHGLNFHSSDPYQIYFHAGKENATHSFELRVGYTVIDNLLSLINATWYQKFSSESPKIAFVMSDPTVRERFSEVPPIAEFVGSVALLLMGFVVLLITKTRD